MNPLLWGLLLAAAALAGCAVTWVLLSSRHQVQLSLQREELAAGRAALSAQKDALQDSLRNVEEATRRKAMDEFLSEIRVEERTYTREYKMLFMSRKSLVRQERIFFRNIPLSNWVEQEMPFEEGADIDQMAKTMSLLAGDMQPGAGNGPVRKLLR